MLQESEARPLRLEALGDAGLTPLVGRARELGMLEDCWAQVLSGEEREKKKKKERMCAAGVGGRADGVERGASEPALMHALTRNRTVLAPFARLASTTMPLPVHRTLFRRRGRAPACRPPPRPPQLGQLENFFEQSGLPLDNALPHLCNMLSIPPDPGRTFPDLPPDQQKKETLLAPTSEQTSHSQTAQARVEEIRAFRQKIPNFVFPTSKGDGRKLVSAATVPPQFIELTAVAVKNSAALVRGGSPDPDALRDLIAYADAYGPVADESRRSRTSSATASRRRGTRRGVMRSRPTP